MRYNKKTGWISDIDHCLSPNHDDRPENMDINLLVIHGISLPPGQYNGNHIEQLFTNSLDPEEHPYFMEICDLKVSTHLLIRRTGELVQFVPLTKRAWHAGVSKFKTKQCCNDFSIGIELEGCDDEPYEQVQYSRLAELTQVIQKYWPEIDSDHIVGHCDIAPGRKTDPGSAFDWEGYRTLLKKLMNNVGQDSRSTG